MKAKNNLLSCSCVILAILVGGFSHSLQAVPENTEPLIRVDLFGYLPNAEKVAVISQPIEGFNAPTNYQPSETFQVKHWHTDETVFTGPLVAWKNGQTHHQSGDAGFWFDFSEVTEPGTYYLYDPVNEVGSYPFLIANEVYNNVLKMAVRTFFIQRLGQDHLPPYIEPAWSDTAAYVGPGQDTEARSRWAMTDPETKRDLQGGWMDAGDPNKYTTYATGVVLDLLDAYRFNPRIFDDFWGIPESGNGVPDILDEIKYELDFLIRAQDATGTDGLVLKVGVIDHNASVPLSQDLRPRYYLPECTSATISGAAMFAMASRVMSEVPRLQQYATELATRAEKAWLRAMESTQSFTQFEEDCDDQFITSGDADQGAGAQLTNAVLAASSLYMLTGNPAYKAFVLEHYREIDPIASGWWGPYNVHSARGMLDFADYLENEHQELISQTEFAEGEQPAPPEFIEVVRKQKEQSIGVFSVTDFQNQTDLYRAYLPDDQHHWGSNFIRSRAGFMNLDFVEFGILEEQAQLFNNVAASYLHWLHGVNPLGKAMLSNMYAYGAENCVNEFYHTWFTDGSDWDNLVTSLYGPPPGYLVGGPNKNFTGTGWTPPANQPPQKSYRDFNAGWPGNSWEVTENAIYYQAAYVLLLSRLIPESAAPVFNDPQFLPELECRYDAESGKLVLENIFTEVTEVPESTGQIPMTLQIDLIDGTRLLEQVIPLTSDTLDAVSIEFDPGEYNLFFVRLIADKQSAIRKVSLQPIENGQ